MLRKFVPPSRLLKHDAENQAPIVQPLSSQNHMQHQQQPLSRAVSYFKVLYIKQDQYLKKKAQKNYADGVLELGGSSGWNLYNEEGKVVWQGRAKQVTGPGAPSAAKVAFQKLCRDKLGKRKRSGDDGEEDDKDDDDEPVRFECGSWLAEVDHDLDPASFKSGSIFLKGKGCQQIQGQGSDEPGFPRPFKPPVMLGTVGLSNLPPRIIKPLHDPNATGAILLNGDRCVPSSGGPRSGEVPVVVDPYLARSLRPHQAEGVRFMYRCTLEQQIRASDGALSGCILADEMGLGKTLQVITLIWTLLRQGPDGKSAVQKVVVVTPSSLVLQWVKEVSKWLGAERLVATALLQNHEAPGILIDFKSRISGNYQRSGLLVCSYETVRRYSEELRGSCDLLVCDEAHRLKSLGGNKTVDALNALGARKRILLTGTPVQNNLQEFYGLYASEKAIPTILPTALLSFVAPNVLDAPAVFKRVYSDPISRGRDRDATQDERDLGEARSSEMTDKVAPYILRRTADLLNKHLPPLTQLVLFCRPSPTQLHLYRLLLQGISSLDSSSSLAVITSLRKVCNSPSLLSSEGSDSGPSNNRTSLDASFVQPPDNVIMASGKLQCLSALLATMVAARQRCVVVSTSTSALDLIDTHICQPQGYSTVRIDGGTNVGDRQALVESFNLYGRGQVFLLSTRAGGAGLNLIGANNLVLFDSDWNPAADLQAMARIWRDGQRKACTVFRLLTSGTIEEKVYQRQITKGDLATATLASGGAAAGRQFAKEELRDLFSLRDLERAEGCETRLLCEGLQLQPLEWMDLDLDHQDSDFIDSHHLKFVMQHQILTAAGKVLRSDVISSADESKEEHPLPVRHGAEAVPTQISNIRSLITRDFEDEDDVDLEGII